MIKNSYLKSFIFFLLLLSYSKYGYGIKDDDDYTREDLTRALLRGGIYDNNRNNKFYTDTPIIKVVQGSVKRGAADALSQAALNVITTILRIVPYSLTKFISMIKAYSYKGAFGTTGLTPKDLTRCSNRIQQVCSRLAKSQVGNLRKTKRATSIENEQNNEENDNSIWKKEKKRIISELEHWVKFFKDVIPCYNSAYQAIDASMLEKQIASVLYALSTENSKEIYAYIIFLIDYITVLINDLQNFNSLDNALEHAEDTKDKLNMIKTTAELIASFLGDGNVKSTSSFSKLDTSDKNDFMKMIGDGRLK